MTENKKLVRKFTVLRIVIISLLLGELLSLISTLPLNLKSLVTILNLNKSKIQEIKNNTEPEHSIKNHGLYETNIMNKGFENYQRLSIVLIIPILSIIFFYHIPVFRYFRIIRKKHKKPGERLRERAKKRIANSAGFTTSVIFLWYAVSFIPYIFFGQNIKAGNNFNLTELSNHFITIRILSALLTILFVYLWQNHRVKTHFIQLVFSEEELRSRQHYGYSLNIKRQLIISNILTAFLPLVLIIFYLLTFISNFPVNEITADQMNLLLANYREFFNNMGFPYIQFLKNMKNISYFNAVDTFFLFISISMGICITLFYLYCITRWTIAEIIIPVKELQTLMKDVSRGRFDNFSIVRNNDEIGELAEGYNTMLSFIQENTSQITKLNLDLVSLNKELERKVEERTSELRELNNDLKSEVEERIRIEEALMDTNNKLRNRNEIMEGELEMARKIQMKLIPNLSPHPSISFYYKPMDKVGGDYYDFVRFESGNKTKKPLENIGVFISDVSGHGVPAAFITSMIKGAVTQGGDILCEPAEFLSYLNDFLISQTNGNFVTAFYCIYNFKSRDLVFSNAGHNHPYIITDKGITMIQADNSGIPLAIMDSAELYSVKKSFKNEKITLPENSKLLLYTDGLVETVNVKAKLTSDNTGDFESTRIIDVIEELKDENSSVFIKKMAGKLIEFRGTDDFDDDVCMICIDVR